MGHQGDLHPEGCRYKRWLKATHNELVLIAVRVHLFPSRTQKLSSPAPTILGGRLPGTIGNANTKASYESRGHFLWIGTGGRPPFRFAILGALVGDGAPSSFADRCTTSSLCSSCPRQRRAAGPVCGARHIRQLWKYCTYLSSVCGTRYSPRCEHLRRLSTTAHTAPALHLPPAACRLVAAAQPAALLYLPLAAQGSWAGKISNANTKLHLKKWSFSLWMGTDGPGHLFK